MPGSAGTSTACSRSASSGAAAYVVLASTHERALDAVPLEALREHAVDVPADPGTLAD